MSQTRSTGSGRSRTSRTEPRRTEPRRASSGRDRSSVQVLDRPPATPESEVPAPPLPKRRTRRGSTSSDRGSGKPRTPRRSTAARPARRATLASAVPRPDALRVLRAPRHRLLVVCTSVLALGMLCVLLLNTLISQGAFRQHELELALIHASEAEERLARQAQLAEAPLEVERRARALGMVPAAAPVFLRLSDGAVLGKPVPAPAAPKKVSFAGAPGWQTPKPKASASAGPSAGADATGGAAAAQSAASAAAGVPSGPASTPGPTPGPTPTPTGTPSPTPTPTRSAAASTGAHQSTPQATP